MKGYKGFHYDFTCRGFQYDVGKTYETTDKPILGESGFHFCKNLKDALAFYPEGRYAEVEALGDVIEETNEVYIPTCVTNKIKIIRELSQEEVIEKTCFGENNTGACNFGDNNKGYQNCGNRNSGSENYGNDNSGAYNHGCDNTGGLNYGSRNKGDENYGHSNIGDRNFGSQNTGCCNYGNANLGSHNMGNTNIGNHNYGTGNSGNFNYGDFNSCNYVYGSFNTVNLKKGLQFFNQPAPDKFTWDDYSHLRCVTQALRLYPLDKLEATYWWESLTQQEKESFNEIPNFNLEMFCALVNVNIHDVNYNTYFNDFRDKYEVIARLSTPYSVDCVEDRTVVYRNNEKEDDVITVIFSKTTNGCIMKGGTPENVVTYYLPFTERFDEARLLGFVWEKYCKITETKNA